VCVCACVRACVCGHRRRRAFMHACMCVLVQYHCFTGLSVLITFNNYKAYSESKYHFAVKKIEYGFI